MRLGIVLSFLLLGRQPSYVESAVRGHRATPQVLEFNDGFVNQLKVPAGFRVNVFATGLKNARMMAAVPDGSIYLTRPELNDVVILRDQDKDGRAEQMRVLASNLERVHGIVLHGNNVYLAGVKSVWVVGASGGAPREIIRNLPDGGQHPNRTIGIGPDGMLYISIGSTCNACRETNPESAALLRAKVDGSGREIYARGLRNAIGFAWHPETRELWGWDHGSDWRGDDAPPEELNLLVKGGDYGWPFCYGNRIPDQLLSANPKDTTKEQFCASTQPPVLSYQAHSAPIAFLFYTAQAFPADYRNDGFVAFRGSWNRKPPTGYKVVRVRYRSGKPEGFEDFLTGFLSSDGRTALGRIAGLAVAQDGSLLVSDDTNGVIYRVSAVGDRRLISSNRGN